MRSQSLSFSLGAVLALLASRAVALPQPDVDVDDDFFLSPAYLVPADIPVEAYDENAPWMRRVDEVIGNVTDVDLFNDEDLVDDHPHGSLETRQFKGTRMRLGRIQTDYGCDGNIASVRNILGDAVFSICTNNFCDYGYTWTRKVKWMENGAGKYKRDRWIQVRAHGNYYGPKPTRGALRDAVRALVKPDSIAYVTRRRPAGGSGIGDSCKMAKFSNYIDIQRVQPYEKRIDIKVEIALNNVNANCLPLSIFATLTGAVNSAVGAILEVASVICAG